MKTWMLALIIGFMFSGACKKKAPSRKARWSGIPEIHACDWEGSTATCIAEDKAYTCVRDEGASDVGCESDQGDVVCAEKK